MSIYRDEIFNYLTKKDNFFSAYEIHQLFPEVKNTLIEKFWLAVKNSLEELEKGTNWEIEMSENIFETYSSLTILLDDSFGVAFEKLHGQTYYGLRIDFDNKKLDRPRINENSSKIEGINWMKKSNWWLGWAYTGANFDNIETLKRILPDNRDNYAKEIADMLFDLAEELQKDVLKMSKMIIL
ncbi:MAG: hypothetical protein QQN41_08790 [Nitrosopumilus sp.]